MRIAVIGTGYVGLVTGVVLAHLGNNVVCVDKDANKVALLKEGVPPIFEPGIEEMLKKGLAQGNLTISESIADATQKSEIVFIAVGTPSGKDGAPDLSAVRAVAEEIADNIREYTVVVNKSTVPVGSGDMVEDILAEKVSKELFDVVSNPEFLREGSAIRDTLEPDRIVIGAKSPEAATKLKELYKSLDCPVIVTDLNSAELIKYASNSFLAMKISFINAISRICEITGANVADVSKGVGLDSRIGSKFLNAGLGWGGSCFPKDVQGLLKTSESIGYQFGLLQEVININEEQTVHFVNRLETVISGFAGKTVALMGLAFKPDTDDIRDAKSLVIISMIHERGGSVRAYDPMASEHVRKSYPSVHYAESVYEVATGADALVLVTEWSAFQQLDLARLGESMNRKVLFDGRLLYSREDATKAGFEYYTIGSQTDGR